MDNAHQLFLDELQKAASLPDKEFSDAFSIMISKAENDFREEEALMEEINFPGIRSHREQHARVLSGLHHVAPAVMNGNVTLGRQTLDLLPHWFMHHLSTMDTALAFAVKLKRQEGSVPDGAQKAMQME